ncbi:xanthine dehydrogenase/oxidase-like [Bacillus rossius redtenbacheri]|uniref:xanthine dehydrogenase/oxidase-like n=1 Tax=Bacillus rossius redtenbacheri TaxID=93214 RepID=UPI002FDE6861
MWSFWASSPPPTSEFFSKYDDKVTFRINSKKYTVDAGVPPNTSLNAFIRQQAGLRGTKSMCLEGGCGACVVAVTAPDPVSAARRTFAVNSCLVLVFSCHGWEVTTVEGIGGKKDGYSKVQTTLAHMNGTQCGYCSPGMVMNMYSLLEAKAQGVKMAEVENSFGGNLCRCTGYRPILDAFKSLCVDAPPALRRRCADIEDLYSSVCPKSGQPCARECGGEDREKPAAVYVTLPGSYWCRVTTLADIFEVMNKMGDVTYMLVSGNTAHGVYRRRTEPQVFVDVNGVKELKTISSEDGLSMGANVSLTDAMEMLYKMADRRPEYAYTRALADHIDLIANVPVRNAGTLAGNLSIKHQYNEFPSDVFLILETVGAKLTIVDKMGNTEVVSPQEYLKLDMKGKVMKQISFPKLDKCNVVKTFKIMPRAQNAHAYVNAGFRFKLCDDGSENIIEPPTVVFGGINPKFIHASKTEEFLSGKALSDEAVMRQAVTTLDGELQPDSSPPDASAAYRSGLAKALLYKCFLGVAADKVDRRYVSGGSLLERPLSSGSQKYETDKSLWPLGQPVPKLEALTQCSGEARYVNDLPPAPGELFAAFVLTRVGQGTLAGVDPSEALKIPGVIKCFTAEDIPGKNNFTPHIFIFFEDEPVFCSGRITHAGQAAALVVAESQQLANMAAAKVKLTYRDVTRPVVSLREAIRGDPRRLRTEKTVHAKYTREDEVSHVVKGSFDLGGQYHFTMETQTCLCVPTEDGMDVFAATQWMHLTQVAVAEALGVPENSINVQVRRLGGAYGAKISRATHVTVACAVAAHSLQRPVRIAMLLESNMEAMGKRHQVASDYEVGVDSEGHIKYLKCDFYENYGTAINEPVVDQSLEHMKSCYDSATWSMMGKAVKTDIPSNTYCRAPSSTEGIAVIETIMEHIAKTVKKDATDVRLKNMNPANNPIPGMIKDIKTSSNYEARKKNVEDFNKVNRWKKRGISLVPMGYPFQAFGNFAAMVSVYGQDGTVAVVHGGIECGQGINTKVAQVTAHGLGIPLDMVSIKASNTMITPNGMVTGGSMTSESCCYAAMKCCETLLERLKPFRTSDKEQTWKELVLTAFMSMVDLSATYMFSPRDGVKPYTIWGATVVEVEVDILTGQHQVSRVDILEDAGKSMSPEVDIGQVEGAFVMGLGYWLHEELVYNEETGELMTNRTWNYKPPGAKDIPIDFRVELRRDAPNPFGVLRSKATGEPPLCMSYGAVIAVRNALASARTDAGAEDEWFQMNGPVTAEHIFLNSLTTDEQFSY